VENAVVRAGYRPLPEPLAVIIQAAESTKMQRFMTCGRLYSYDTLLERLAQDLQDMAVARGPFL
jgi:hypothetical protein